MQLVKEMGISIVRLPDGRVQLLHTAASAVSSQAGEEGLLFIQEMIELSRQQTSPAPDSPPKLVTFPGPAGTRLGLQAGPAQFGPELLGSHTVTGPLVAADPLRACSAAQQVILVVREITLMIVKIIIVVNSVFVFPLMLMFDPRTVPGWRVR